MGWLITLGILFLLAILPLGVNLKYDAEGALVRLILGPIRIKLFPAKPKDNKEKPKKEKKSKGQKAEKAAAEKVSMPPKPEIPPKEEPRTGGSWTDFLPLVKTVLDFLGDFRRKLRVDHLELKLVMAGDDPCDLAVNYGRAWAAVGNLMPQLEKIFVIKKRDVEVECDFTATETLVTARLDLTITLGRLLAAVVRFAIRALKQFLEIKNKRKGGAKV
jgi:hypothetical protein